MRILIICEVFPTYGTKSVVTLANTLAERGHEVVVASTSTGMHGEKLAIDNEWKFRIVRFQSIPIPRIPYTYTPFARRLLANLARDFKPDIIHIHFLMYWLSLNACNLAKDGYPLLLTLHGFTLPTEPLNKLSGFALKVLYHTMGVNLIKSISQVIGVSESVIEKFMRVYPNRKLKTDLIPIGLDTDTLLETVTQPRDITRAEFELNNKCVFVYLGRVVREKGLLELAHSFKMMRKKHQNVGLFVLGDGDFLPHLREYLKGVPDVHILGFKENIGTYLNASDVFVLPSYREGLSTALLEAMYFKLPFIATNVGGISDIRKMGAQGSIIPVGNIKKLYEEMDRYQHLIPSNRRKMGLTNHRIVELNLTWDVLVEKINSIYMKLQKNNN